MAGVVMRWRCLEPGCVSMACGVGDVGALRVLGWQVVGTSARCPMHRTDVADPATIERDARGLQSMLSLVGFAGGIAGRIQGAPAPPGVDLRPAVVPGVVRGTHPPPPSPAPVQVAEPEAPPELVEPASTDVPDGRPSWAIEEGR